jgi:hypothetical protein
MFVKDSFGLIINKDDAYYKSVLVRRQQKRKIEEVEGQLTELSCELKEIKSILKDLLNGKNYG